MKSFFKKFRNILLDTEEKVRQIIVDGTRFGYDGKESLKMLRGKEIREMSSHVKVELMICKKR